MSYKPVIFINLVAEQQAINKKALYHSEMSYQPAYFINLVAKQQAAKRKLLHHSKLSYQPMYFINLVAQQQAAKRATGLNWIRVLFPALFRNNETSNSQSQVQSQQRHKQKVPHASVSTKPEAKQQNGSAETGRIYKAHELILHITHLQQCPPFADAAPIGTSTPKRQSRLIRREPLLLWVDDVEEELFEDKRCNKRQNRSAQKKIVF